MNGLKFPSTALFTRLMTTHQLVFLQGTKFTSPDRLQSAHYFLQRQDSMATSYWYHTTYPSFNGHNGVGMVLVSNNPLTDVQDITYTLALSTQLHNRYMVLSARLGGVQYYLHNLWRL